MSKENKRLYFYLALITAAALAVRLWGIAFGLPHKEARPDETTVIYMAILTLKNGLAPASLVYPTGYIYLLAFCYKIWGAFSGGTEGLVRQYAVNADVLFLISRGLSAVFGALTVLPVFRTAKNLFGLKVGYAAAVFAAFCVLLVRDSHFGTLDATAVFFIACSLDFSVAAY
ncbi:MAG: glycosyltransferase family 39 protein, partial [Elusimicrobiaceae bacterium]